MPASHILAIDQGTTSTRAIVFDSEARPVGSAQIELTQHYPQPGWVEHDPEEILWAVVEVCRKALAGAGLGFPDIAALGIANQRETTVLWDRKTGKPVANAVVWQCRRTTDMCADLVNAGHGPDIRARTGLVIDPYFSATKLRWLLDRVPDGQKCAEAGELCFGTVDSWLLYKLTGGRVHATDATNASRTMLLNLHDLSWDEALMGLFNVPEAVLPEVRPSSGEFGVSDAGVLGAELPISGIAGDQHAALYGHACFKQGMAKCTYGTGAFVLANAGRKPNLSGHGLIATLAWQTGGRRVYALEGSIFSTGAAVQWLRDGLGIVASAQDTESMAQLVVDNGGVYFVPAFVGLGAPHWVPDARGSIVGLTRGVTKEHIVRAALEATAYQVRDVLDAMGKDAGASGDPLRVDGGQAANAFLMQFQADILDRPVETAAVRETTALGAAFLAGLAAGVWESEAELRELWSASRVYEPSMSASVRERLYAGWQQALRQSSPRGLLT